MRKISVMTPEIKMNFRKSRKTMYKTYFHPKGLVQKLINRELSEMIQIYF